MTVGTFDRKTIYLLLGGLAAIAILRWGVYSDRATAVAAPVESVPAAEKRLDLLRQKAATVPGKEALLKQVAGELQTREKGILQAETAAQARKRVAEIIELADDDILDITRSRDAEQEVLDLIDESPTR